MKIINGKKFYKKQEDEAINLDCEGWDHYDGQNYQWYSLYYNPDCGLVILKAHSTSCFGDHKTRYFDCPEAFRKWCEEKHRDWEDLFGEIDEDNKIAMGFVDKLLKNN